MMYEVEMKDGGIVGKLQVKLMVPFPPLIFFFKTEKLFFCVFSWKGKKNNNNNDAWSVMQAWK